MMNAKPVLQAGNGSSASPLKQKKKRPRMVSPQASSHDTAPVGEPGKEKWVVEKGNTKSVEASVQVCADDGGATNSFVEGDKVNATELPSTTHTT